MASGGAQGSLLLHNLRTGVMACALSIGGGGGSGGSVQDSINPTGRVAAVRFQPKQPSVLASCGGDGVIRLWDVQHSTQSTKTAAPVHQYCGHTAAATDIQNCPTNAALLASSPLSMRTCLISLTSMTTMHLGRRNCRVRSAACAGSS